MTIDKEHLKELESFDPDDLVGILGISSEQLLRAFPGHAYDYIRDNFGVPENEDDDRQLELFDDIERLGDDTTLDGDYGIAQRHVSSICSGESWRNVDGTYEPPPEDT